MRAMYLDRKEVQKAAAEEAAKRHQQAIAEEGSEDEDEHECEGGDLFQLTSLPTRRPQQQTPTSPFAEGGVPVTGLTMRLCF